jgi:hypothetical protein
VKKIRKKTRRQIALEIILAVEQFESILEDEELARLAEGANDLELGFLENVGRNLATLNEMIVRRRRDRATL